MGPRQNLERDSDTSAKLGSGLMHRRNFKPQSALLRTKDIAHRFNKLKSSVGVTSIRRHDTKRENTYSLLKRDCSSQRDEELIAVGPPLAHRCGRTRFRSSHVTGTQS